MSSPNSKGSRSQDRGLGGSPRAGLTAPTLPRALWDPALQGPSPELLNTAAGGGLSKAAGGSPRCPVLSQCPRHRRWGSQRGQPLVLGPLRGSPASSSSLGPQLSRNAASLPEPPGQTMLPFPTQVSLTLRAPPETYTQPNFPTPLGSYHLVTQIMRKGKGIGVSASAFLPFPPLQIYWEASPEMQSKCHQKGKNNQVCDLPCPQLLSSSSFGNVRVDGNANGELIISE